MRTNDDNAGNKNKTNANLVVGCAFKPFKLQSNFSGFGSTDNPTTTTTTTSRGAISHAREQQQKQQ